MNEYTSRSRQPEIHQTIEMTLEENNVLLKSALPEGTEMPKTLRSRTFSSSPALIHQIFPEKVVQFVGFEFTGSTKVQKEACLNPS